MPNTEKFVHLRQLYLLKSDRVYYEQRLDIQGLLDPEESF